MATLTPYSSSYKREDKYKQTSLSFHTPAFSKENQPDNQIQYEEKTSRKKVLFTPRPEAVKEVPVSCPKSTSTQAYTSCNSSTSSTRTSCKETLDTHPANEVKKSLTSTLGLTPSTTNKKVSKKEDEAETQKVQRYGKRKIQYTDTDDEEPEIKQEKIEEAEGRKSKQLKRTTISEPQHTMLYLYNSTKTQIYSFPVFQECDLRYRNEIQDLLKDADIDNDCETENEILDYSIFQAKKDLAKGIQMQREAEQQARKAPSFEERLARSQESDKDKESGEKVQDEVNFWSKVSSSFRDLFGQDRKSL